MKTRLLCFLLITTLLTGCSNSSDVLMAYKESNSVTTNSIINLQTTDIYGLFAKNLTVIPKDQNSKKDNNLTAQSSLLINTTKNEMIYGTNVYERLYPASLTKLATALVVFEYGNFSDIVTVSKRAGNITESGAKLCGFKEGDQIVLKDLLTSLLVYSGNDAGIAIAEHIAGSEAAFADKMNDKLEKLGAVDSHFVNAHGLHDNNHYSTAYDLYLMFQELLKQDDFLEIISLGEYTLNYTDKTGKSISKSFTSTDRFLIGMADAPKGITVLGGKTGTTFKAGSCLILASENEKEELYISLILKAESSDNLYSQMEYLLNLIEN